MTDITNIYIGKNAPINKIKKYILLI